MKLLSLVSVTIAFSFLLIAQNLSVEKPELVTKEEWGAEPLTGEIAEHQIKYITIHHGGVEFGDDKDPAEYMRNLQSFSQNDKNWIDIPYHFCIDLNGNIYEARPLQYPGDTNTEYDPTGHALINVMGNYEVQKIKPEQLEAIAHLSAWLAQEYEVPVDSIATHKDHSDQTVCPGEDLYKYFEDGTMLQMIQEYLNK